MADNQLVTFVAELKGFSKADASQKGLYTRWINAYNGHHVLTWLKKAGFELESKLKFFKGPAKQLSDGVNVVLSGSGEVVTGDETSERYWVSPATSDVVSTFIKVNNESNGPGLVELVDESAGGGIALVSNLYAEEILGMLKDRTLVHPSAVQSGVDPDAVNALLQAIKARTQMYFSEQEIWLLTRGWFRMNETELSIVDADARPELRGWSGLPSEACQKELEHDAALVAELLEKPHGP